MQPSLSVFVEGLPKPQPRPRFGKGHAYTPDSAKEWKECIALAVNAEWKRKHPITGPCALGVRFYFPAKLTEKGKLWHDKKPDLDNCVKAVMDTLTECGVWRDDCIVACLDVKKGYAAGGKVGAMLFVEELKGEA